LSLRCKLGLHKEVSLKGVPDGMDALFNYDFKYCEGCCRFSYEKISIEPGLYKVIYLYKQSKQAQVNLLKFLKLNNITPNKHMSLNKPVSPPVDEQLKALTECIYKHS
jgi:hypothetical protein